MWCAFVVNIEHIMCVSYHNAYYTYPAVSSLSRHVQLS